MEFLKLHQSRPRIILALFDTYDLIYARITIAWLVVVAFILIGESEAMGELMRAIWPL